MPSRPRTVLATCAAVGALVLTGLGATGPSNASPPSSGDRAGHARGPVGGAGRASLRIKPVSKFVGGQRLSWIGNIGARGKRRIILQQNNGRQGDTWVNIEGFHATTAPNGSFRFSYPSPAGFGISYRVAAQGGHVTPKVTFNYPRLLSQDLVVYVKGQQPGDDQSAVINRPFDLVVDTTPTLNRRPDTIGLKPIPGRKLTLQRRTDSNGWKTLARTKEGRDGTGTFTGITETATGDVVYRVRQENWFKNGNRIGWQPSFPTYVQIRAQKGFDRAMARERRDGGSSGSGSSGSTSSGSLLGTAGVASDTASQRYGWAPSLFDFAWTSGESLTSPPARGTRRKGKWLDFTDGAGRVSHYNEGLYLDSKRLNDSGRGDFGTLRATLQGNAQRYGRWEVRLRTKSSENNAEDYAVVAQLVPENAPDDDCRTITIARYQPHGKALTFGAHGGGRTWNGSRALGRIQDVAVAFAVEVTRNHVTWFREGKPIGTVRSPAASSGVPMTLRLSLVGAKDARGNYVEMNNTDTISDWERGFTLERGRQVSAGGVLDSQNLPGC